MHHSNHLNVPILYHINHNTFNRKNDTKRHEKNPSTETVSGSPNFGLPLSGYAIFKWMGTMAKRFLVYLKPRYILFKEMVLLILQKFFVISCLDKICESNKSIETSSTTTKKSIIFPHSGENRNIINKVK